ncbi:MAG: hypothetical protein AAF577_07290 [Pseudomonadota bacterium]
MLAAATLLLINVPAGAPLTALPGGVWFSDGARTVSLQVIGLEEAALAIEAARSAAANDPLQTVEDGIALGYATVTLSRRGPDGEERTLYLSFGEEHLLVTEQRVDGAAEAAPVGEVLNLAPAGAGTPDGQGTGGPLDLLRPGSEAGRHPGRVDLMIDGYLMDDAAGVLPLDFFSGPLTLEIRPEGAAVE